MILFALLQTLNQLWGGAPLCDSQVQALCGDLMRGLAFMHGLGIVHGDLKGGNVLLVSRQAREAGWMSLRIADFGMAGMSGARSGALQEISKSEDGQGSDVPPEHVRQYRPPEVLLGIRRPELAKESDMWAAGCLCKCCMLSAFWYFKIARLHDAHSHAHRQVNTHSNRGGP